MNQQLFYIQEIPSGALIGFSAEAGIHTFEFDNDFTIEAHSGWRLIEPGAEAKTVIGSRDVDVAENGLEVLSQHLKGYSLIALLFYSMDDRFLACFEGEDNEPMRLEIFKESSTEVNWRITGEDFEDTDHLKLIQTPA